jgi:hypothetical protein
MCSVLARLSIVFDVKTRQTVRPFRARASVLATAGGDGPPHESGRKRYVLRRS